MRGISYWFFFSAAIYVALGMILGIWMSAAHDHSLAPVHGHLNLIGWVSMALFGIYYHLVPAAAEGVLPKAHFALATASVWILTPGIAMAILGTSEILAIIGSMVALLSILLFITIIFMNRRSIA